MEHEDKISRRKALGKFGRVGLAATAAAGFADLVGRPSFAHADTAMPAASCGGQANVFIKDEDGCTINCQSAGSPYYCYQAYNQNTHVYGNTYCCSSPNQAPVICSCTRPSVVTA